MKKYLSTLLTVGLMLSMAALVVANPNETPSDAAIEFEGGWDVGVIDPQPTDQPELPVPTGVVPVPPTSSPGIPIPTFDPAPTPEVIPVPTIDPEVPPPEYLSGLGIDFWRHDISDARVGASSNPYENNIAHFHSLRIRNGAWDPDRFNGNGSVAGMWVLANNTGWRVDVGLGAFTPGLAGAEMQLTPAGPVIQAINPSGNIPVFSAPNLLPTTGVTTIVNGEAVGTFAGGRNFEGRLALPINSIPDSDIVARANLTWTFLAGTPMT